MSLYWNKVYVLKLDHRPERDKRITMHTALVARAFGANGFLISGVCDKGILNNLRDVEERWGGRIYFECINNPKKFVRDWMQSGGEVIHLTMYGIPVDDAIYKVQSSPRDKLIIVGGPKVDPEYYELSDYNIAIGNQPHSEVAALAIFLDRLFKGRELYLEFSGGRAKIVPSMRGKHVEQKER